MSYNSSDPYWDLVDFFDIQEYLATELFLNVQKSTSPREVLLVLADAHHGMPLFPVTLITHCILVAMNFRGDPYVAKFVYSNPAVSLLGFLLTIQFGCIATSLLLGEIPILCYLDNGDIPTVGVAAAVWFLVFFSPFDLFYKICRTSLVSAILHVLVYLRKSRNVMSGVLQAGQKYPKAPLVMVAIGTLKGTGSLVGLNLFKLLCVKESTERGRITDKVHVTFTTKVCFLLSVAFTLGELGVFSAPRPVVLFSGAMFIIMSSVLGRITSGGDIFSMPATILWGMATILAPKTRPVKTAEETTADEWTARERTAGERTARERTAGERTARERTTVEKVSHSRRKGKERDHEKRD